MNYYYLASWPRGLLEGFEDIGEKYGFTGIVLAILFLCFVVSWMTKEKGEGPYLTEEDRRKAAKEIEEKYKKKPSKYSVIKPKK